VIYIKERIDKVNNLNKIVIGEEEIRPLESRFERK